MAAKLPISSLLWLIGASLAFAPAGARSQIVDPATAKPTFHVPEAQSRLEDAILALESRFSISASIRHEADLFGKKVFGSGIYREQRSGPHPLLRLELKIQLGDQASTLVQVCDGTNLWIYRKILGEVALSRIDVAKVRRAIEKADELPQPGRLDKWPGIGGLSRLLRGLNSAFGFYSQEEGQLKTQTAQVPVWKLRGEWKPDKLAALLPDQKEDIEQGKPADLSRLPNHVPDRVVVFLGKQDLFPYRIEYRRQKPRESSEAGGPPSRAMVIMQLYDVNLNMPIDPTRFVYNPGNLKVDHRTDAYLKKLGLEE